MLENNSAANLAKQEIIDELLSNLPQDTSIKVDLPSECRVYPDLPTDEPVTIRPVTFEDEKLIASARGEDGSNLLLERCVPNVQIGNLLSMDKIFLLLKVREISYGADYHPTIACNHCGAETKSVFNISDLTVNPVPDDFTDTVTVDLPVSKRTVVIRIPRVKDDKYLKDIYSNLWRFVVSVDGHTDTIVKSGFIKGIPIRDSKTLINAMALDYGVETKIQFNCPECSKTSVIELPIDSGFFGVS